MGLKALIGRDNYYSVARQLVLALWLLAAVISDKSHHEHDNHDVTNANYLRRFRRSTSGTGSAAENGIDSVVVDVVKSKYCSNFSSVVVDQESNNTVGNSTSHRPGVIILGMHRSGTSMLGGLMYQGMGLHVGDRLIGSASDNKKGFFERSDVVLQNDEFFTTQSMFFDHATYKYNPSQAIRNVVLSKDSRYINPSTNGTKFKNGITALEFLNNPKNDPYMLKDPRLCITLRTWLPLLCQQPAILFTYRHPLDVALSLKERHSWYDIERGLKSWYVYNRMAIHQSHDLCRVVTSHLEILKSPMQKLKRVYDELHLCGVDVPHPVEEKVIRSFMDMDLQHGDMTLKDDVCAQSVQVVTPPSRRWNATSEASLALYREAIRVYCAINDRSALSLNFDWDLSIHD
jgi:hypothetical protein